MAAPASDLASQGWATGPYTPTAAVRAMCDSQLLECFDPQSGVPTQLAQVPALSRLLAAATSCSKERLWLPTE